VTLFVGNMPPKSPKMGVDTQFQDKTLKYINHNVSKTINPIKTKFEDQPETNNYTLCVGGLILHKSNPIWLPAGHLEKMDMTS